ncbi:MAG: hypothetical protein J7M05_05170 [Anaerolineae bacterium]|nr:hypothetical protein [Anaerolineae bacterium]
MARLAALLRVGYRPYEILVFLPQRAQVVRYEQVLASLDAPIRGGVDCLTFYSFAKRSVALFWPRIASVLGFAHPEREPTFLTLETAQYYMWRIVEPLIRAEGYFSSLKIRRERLLSQLIDNLNKAALVGFDYKEVYSRLKGAWTGSLERLHSYWQAQDCITRFREYCLAHNLVDFSLSVEAFQYLWKREDYQQYFRTRYHHLLVDNLEENVPVALDFIRWALEQIDGSSILAYDLAGGHRIFLGADARYAAEFANYCDCALECRDLVRPAGAPLAFAGAVRRALGLSPLVGETAFQEAVRAQYRGKYWVNMLDWVVERISQLVHEEGVSPREIAVIAPYVSEVLRFALEDGLARKGISMHLLRPSRPLRDDPIVRALLTWVILGHPAWREALEKGEYLLPVEDVALALQVALADLDPIRARRLARAAFPREMRRLIDLDGQESLLTPEERGHLWEEVGYQIRRRYKALLLWLEDAQQRDSEGVDIFLSRFFGSLLSTPGFGFYDQPERARVYGRLVESAAKFREAVRISSELDQDTLVREYVRLVLDGIASGEYVVDWPTFFATDAVLLSPAYAYLTRDLASHYQFWVDLGSDGWWNRPNQPLTHPYVLSRHWPVGRPWRDIEEERSRKEALGNVVLGLAARCTGGIFLVSSELGVDGTEQDGRFQRAIVRAMRMASNEQ